MKARLSRRTLLRGVIGGAAVAVGLPVLEIFANSSATAYASGESFPKRFGLFFWGNGILPAKWIPTGDGAGAAWTLSEQLQPLAAVKDYVTVVSGMESKVENIDPHFAGAAGILSGAPLLLEVEHRTFTAPSIDQVVAAGIGGQTRFRSLEFGAFPGVGFSYNGPDNLNPPESSPKAFFNRLFGGFAAGGAADVRWKLRRSVLDAVLEEAAALKQRLGKNDRQRLDQHLTGIRELEKRIARIDSAPENQSASCAAPKPPLADYPDIDGRPQLSAKNRAMCDVVTMALACDQTRVFSNFFTYPQSNHLFPGAPSGHHKLTHDEGGDQPAVHAIVKQIVAEYAYLVAALQAVPEGAGTLLDQCIVLGTSDCSHGRTHAVDEFPILYAGSAGGYLKQGYHYRSLTKENTSKAMLTFMRALGMTNSSFGTGAGLATSELTGIVA